MSAPPNEQAKMSAAWGSPQTMSVDWGAPQGDISVLSFHRDGRVFSFAIGLIPRAEWLAIKNWRRIPGCQSYTSIKRWVTEGLRAKSGDFVKLPSFRLGGRRYTTMAAFDWWNKELDL